MIFGKKEKVEKVEKVENKSLYEQIYEESIKIADEKYSKAREELLCLQESTKISILLRELKIKIKEKEEICIKMGEQKYANLTDHMLVRFFRERHASVAGDIDLILAEIENMSREADASVLVE